MDFPSNLFLTSFVTGKEEFQQTFSTLFKNNIGSFYSSRSLGSCIPEHSGSDDTIHYGVERTIEQINGASLISCRIDHSADDVNVYVECKYRGDIIGIKIS